MNAIQFIQQHGVENAREVVEGAPEWATVYDTEVNDYYRSSITTNKDVNLSELKRLVESVHLVKEHYTLDRAKSYAASPYTAPELKTRLEQAIADCESIYSDNDMGDDTHIENHISKNCKVIDYE